MADPKENGRRRGILAFTFKGSNTYGHIGFLLPFLILIATTATFFPALGNGFAVDDRIALLENADYHGLSASNLRWMFTTFHTGQYHPLVWVSFAVDYLVWGMDPFGYHLANLVLHMASALLLYVIARILLRSAFIDDELHGGTELWREKLSLAAAVAALFFALHPLRVEVVAWAVERQDALSGFFFLLTILLYLLAAKRQDGRVTARRLLLVASIGCYVLALLSKVMVVTLPVVLLVLDVYPLRRLKGNPLNWISRRFRPVLLEKVPYALVVLPFVFVTTLIRAPGTEYAPDYDSLPVERVAQSFFELVHYLWKTVVPVRILPTGYPMASVNTWGMTIAMGVPIVAVTIALIVFRRRIPWLLAVWVSYVTMLSPVLGFAYGAPQFPANRYTYHSCVGWAMLAGGGLLYLFRSEQRGRMGKATIRIILGATVVGIFSLGALSWRQTKVWGNTETVWKYVIANERRIGISHLNMGNYYYQVGQVEQAVIEYAHAIRVKPHMVEAHYALGIVLGEKHDWDLAISAYEAAIRLKPDFANAYNNLGFALARKGEQERAIAAFEQAVAIDPANVRVLLNLGYTYTQLGDHGRAASAFAKIIELDPENALVHGDLAASYYRLKNYERAMQHAERAEQLGAGLKEELADEIRRAASEAAPKQ